MIEMEMMYHPSIPMALSRPGAEPRHRSNSASHVYKRGVPTDHWRAVVDNFMIEFLAALFINVSAVMYGGMKANSADPLFADPWIQLIPAIVMGLVMMSLKDDDFFFPDTTQTMTLLMWAVGAYDNWVHPLARIMGQTAAIGATLWLFKDTAVPQWVSFGRLPSVIFATEMFCMIIEHMAVVYLFLPLLPAIVHSQIIQQSKGLRVQPKRHPETEEPTNQMVMHASVAFAGVHWCLRLSFLSEINPSLSLVKSTLWVWQYQRQGSNHTHTEHHIGVEDEIWSECLMAVWGQLVGFLIALVYIVHYLPLRKSIIAAAAT
jgi:hypothetical protein